MAKKLFSDLSNVDQPQEIANEIKPVELLTSDAKRDPFSIDPPARKTALDDSIMVGVRMTKRQRKALKQMAFDLEISIQELVRQAIVLYRDSKSLR